MADLAALRASHEAGLAGGEGREVVVVHVALGGVAPEAVEHLLHAGHAQRGHVEDLGLTPLEQAGAVRRGDQVDLRGQGAHVAGAATVDADALLDDALAHDLLGQGPDGGLDLLLGAGHVLELREQLGDDRRLHLVLDRGALGLVGDLVGLGHPVGGGGLDGGEDLVAVVAGHRELEDLGLAAHGVDQLLLELDGVLDVALGGLEARGHDLLGDLGGTGLVELPGVLTAAGLDHHHRHVAVVEQTTGDDHLEGRLLAFVPGRVGGPGALGSEGQAHGAQWAVEGDGRDAQRGRGGVDGQDVVGVLLVRTEDGAHDVDLVAEALGERGAQRAVDQAAGQDGLVAGLALPAEERAGDLARGVEALLDVDGEGEEVRPFTHRPGGRGRDQHHRVAHADGDGTVGQSGQLAGLEGQGLVGPGNGTGYGVKLRHGLLSSGTRLRVPLCGAAVQFPVVGHPVRHQKIGAGESATGS